MQLTFNCNRGPKTKPAKFADFHPFRKTKRRGMSAADVRSRKKFIEAIARSMK